MSTPEGRVKAKVTKALKGRPHTWRFMPVQNGMGAPALDYIICIEGYLVAIETKVPGKQLTPRQKLTAREITAARGTVYVVRDDADLALALHQMRDTVLLNRNRVCGGAIYDTLWDGSLPGDDECK